MKEHKPSKYLPGLIALSSYFILIGMLVYYFNTRHHQQKSLHYVQKDEKRIQVTLMAPKPKVIPKIEQKPKPKKTVEKKKVIKKKVIKKKVVKEKVVKKARVKRETNQTKVHKSAVDLFANVKTASKKSFISISDKPIKTTSSHLIKVNERPLSASERISSALKVQKSSDSGVENSYLAKVQNMLEGWPAQSDYAGEKIKVLLHIDPTGSFNFRLKTASNNEDFNLGLIAYLKQLQTIGFGSHKGKRTYKFEVEFIAKE